MSRGSGGGDLDGAQIPLGGRFWRALGGRGALVVGYVLAAVHLALVVATTTVSEDHESLAGLVSATGISTAVVPLLATCFLWIGELSRRGRWGGPSGHKPDALLPQGSTTAQVRFVPVGWHALWLAVTAGVAVLLLVASARGLLGDDPGGRTPVWFINGLLLAGVAGAVGGSLLKKVVWLRRRSRASAPRHPAVAARRPLGSRGRTFWRWFGYRWRLDLWFCALGALALWASGVLLQLGINDPDEPEELRITAFALLGGGALVLAVGLFATTQFWRAREHLASSESLA
ncbi:MAG: hypothetical protein GX593_05400 [Actinomycetales bacterium]|nr:hypothetical protein [Actinomycetales bacterium]